MLLAAVAKRIRIGMVGGGMGAFIGAVHRHAFQLDGLYELVCGAFSSTAERSRESGQALGVSRTYDSFAQMIEAEKALPADVQMQVMSIVTPNHVHFEPAKLALQAGFDVVMDKPMTFSLAEARELKAVVAKSGRKLCLTHTYTGYPLVKEARERIAKGALGKIRKVYVEYPQGWLSTSLESSDQKQAAWRTDPTRSGIAGAIGDIGTHAFNLAEYVSGHKVKSLCAEVGTFVPGRKLDDDGAALLRFENGVTGMLFATQIAAGEENCVKIRVYGEEGGLEWRQDDANTLLMKWLDRPTEVLRCGSGYLGGFAKHNSRTPGGHPEGYLEAFANIYRNFALNLNGDISPEAQDYPGVEEGVRGMAFIEAMIASGQSEQKWVEIQA
jgi:predicted dehydrogenase